MVVGSVIEAGVLGYQRWEVVEVRQDPGGLISVTGADGHPIPLGGTLVCRGVRWHSGTPAQTRVDSQLLIGKGRSQWPQTVASRETPPPQ
jgi:hypothetical protein